MATSIAYVHICNKPVVKMLYHTVNINNTEAELFAIKYSINQAINSISICKIIIATDSIHTVKKSLNYHFIPFKSTWQLFYKNSTNSSLLIRRIQSNFRNVPVVITGCFIKLSTMNLNHLTLSPFVHISLHRIIAKKGSVIISPIIGKWFSKLQI